MAYQVPQVALLVAPFAFSEAPHVSSHHKTTKMPQYPQKYAWLWKDFINIENMVSIVFASNRFYLPIDFIQTLHALSLPLSVTVAFS